MQQHEHPQNITINADGSETYTEVIVIDSDGMLTRKHSGGICVHEPARFTIARGAIHNGSLVFESGTAGSIEGVHNGSLHVEPRAVVEIHGAQNGSTHVSAGGVVRVAPTGRLPGSLHVDGLVVKQPQTRNGIAYYTW
jgi:hypothetical protein